MKRLKRGDIVEIKANKWRDSYGNTYHNVQVYVNDDYVGESGNTYGYGDHYMQTAREMIFDKYKAPYGYDTSNPIYMLKDKGVKVISMDSMVDRKRDLGYFERGGQVALAKAMGSVAKKGEREIEEGRAEIKGIRNRISQSEDKIRDYKSGINEENKTITKREGDIKNLKKELLDIDKTVKNAKREQIKFDKGGFIEDVKITFKRDTEVDILDKDGIVVDEENYKKGEQEKVDVLSSDGNFLMVQFEDGYVAYINKEDVIENKFAKGGPIYEGHKVRIKDSGKTMKVTDISKNKKDQVEFTGKEGTYLIGDIEKMAKGGSVEDKEYVLEHYYVYVHRDSYEEGELDMVHSWDSSDYGDDNKTFSSKSALMDFIKEVIDRDTQEDNTRDDYFMIESDDEETTIDYSVLCKYNDLDRGYDHYEKANDEEIEQWKKGDLELFSVGFTFKVKVYEPRKKAEFAKGGVPKGVTYEYPLYFGDESGRQFVAIWYTYEEDRDDADDVFDKLVEEGASPDEVLLKTGSGGYKNIDPNDLSDDEYELMNYGLQTSSIKGEKTYAKGGTITKKEGNELFIGGLAGVLFGIFFGSK